jgi:hypothetical protein
VLTRLFYKKRKKKSWELVLKLNHAKRFSWPYSVKLKDPKSLAQRIEKRVLDFLALKNNLNNAHRRTNECLCYTEQKKFNLVKGRL